MNTHAPITIVATLDLTEEHQRRVVEMIRRFHGGRWPVFEGLYDMRRDGDELVTLSRWRGQWKRITVVRWSLTEMALRWRDHRLMKHASTDFYKSAKKALSITQSAPQ